MNLHLALVTAYLALPISIVLWSPQSAHDVARTLQPALLLALLAGFKSGVRPRLHKIPVVGLVWSGAACVSASEPSVATREFVLLVGLLLMAWQVASWPQSLRLMRLMITISLAYGFIFCIVLMAAAAIHDEVMPFALVFGFDNPRHLNHTQTVLIPLALGIAAVDSDRRWRIAAWAAASLAITIAVILMGRATLLALVIGMAGLATYFRGEALPFLKPAALSMILGTVLGLGVLHGFGADLAGEAAATGSWHNRLQLWRAAVDDAGQSPWGVGPMHFSRVTRGDAAHPHNAYLQVAAEFGWPAALALVCCVLRGLARLAERVRQTSPGRQRLLGMSLWVTMAAIAVDATLSGNMVMPLSQVWVFLAIGLALGWYRDAGPPAQQAEPFPAAGPWVWRGVTAAMLVLTLVSTWEFMQPEVQLLESQWRSQPKGDTFSPRFWRDGWF